MRAEDFLNGKVDSSGGLGSAEDFLGAVEPKKQNKGIMADIGTDIKRGIMSVPGAITGLADIPIAAVTGGAYANKAADVIGDITGFQPSKWAEDAKAEYSPERNAASQKVEQAWADNENPFSKAADGDLSGIGNIAKSYIQNPRHTVGQVVESVPSMLAGGLAGRGIAAVSKLSPIVGGAIGEGAIMAGQQMDQLSDTEADPRMAAAASLATGVVGAGIGAAGGKLAQRMGVVDPETALAGGAARGIAGEAADKTIKGAIADGAKRVAGGAASEGLFEELPQSVLEQALSNLAQGKDWSEGVDRAAIEGTLAGSLMGGAFNVLPPKQQEQQAKPPADDDKPDISGLLPSPTYTGTPNDQMLAAESERQAAIDKAQADADALYAMRDKFERDMATSFRGAPEIITDPAPIKQRIDALLGINQSRLSGVARSNYERAIENAFGEQIGFAVGNDGLEIPVTMADYIASKVAVGDIDRNSAIAARLSGNANQAADARLQQIADEEATVQPDIPAIPVVGPLSAAANMAVQPELTTLESPSAKTGRAFDWNSPPLSDAENQKLEAEWLAAMAVPSSMVTPKSEPAPFVRQDGTDAFVPDSGMSIVHGSGNSGMTDKDIQIVRTNGQKQGKKGRTYGGFYGTSEADSAQAEGYANMMGGQSTLYDVRVRPGTKILNKTGDITRLSEKYINELVSQGYGLVVGTDPRGRTEYAVIDKSAIDSMSKRSLPVATNQPAAMSISQQGANFESKSFADALQRISLPGGLSVQTERNSYDGGFTGRLNIMQDGAKVGHVDFNFNHESGEVTINKSEIAESLRGKGIAKAVYSQINATLRTNGLPALGSDPKNMSQHAVNLWKSLVKSGAASARTDGRNGYQFNDNQPDVAPVKSEQQQTAKGAENGQAETEVLNKPGVAKDAAPDVTDTNVGDTKQATEPKVETPSAEDSIGWTRMTTVEREGLLIRAGYGGKGKQRLNLGGVGALNRAWEKMGQGIRDKLTEAHESRFNQNPIKNEDPAAATGPSETNAANQDPIKKDAAVNSELPPNFDPDVQYAKNPDGSYKTKGEYTPEEWAAYTKSAIDKKLSQPKYATASNEGAGSEIKLDASKPSVSEAAGGDLHSEIDKTVKSLEDERQKWIDKDYKDGKKVVRLKGNGPSNKETMTVGSINRRRRDSVINELARQIMALKKLKDISIDSLSSRLAKAVSRGESTQDFERRVKDSQGNIRTRTEDEMIEAEIWREFIDPNTSATAPATKALLSAYRSHVAGTKNKAAPIALSEGQLVAETQDWLKELFGNEVSDDAGPVSQPKTDTAPVAKQDKAPAVTKKKSRNSIDPSKDSLFVAIAKAGGIDTDSLVSSGVDSNDITVLTAARVSKKTGALGKKRRMPISFGFAMPLHKNGGASIDGMRETLQQYGYLPEGSTERDFLDLFNQELRGDPVYTAQAQERMADEDADAFNAMMEEEQNRIDDELAAREISEDDLGFYELSEDEYSLASDAASFAFGENEKQDENAVRIGMRALGFTEEEINDELAKNSGVQRESQEVAIGSSEEGNAARNGTGAANEDARQRQGEEGFNLAGQTNEQAAEQFVQQKEGESDTPSKAQADRERDAVPFSLNQQSQPKPQGIQTGLFTADGRVSQDAKPESPSEMGALKAEMGQAIGELASILGAKANLMPEEESRIIPVMSKIFRIAAKMGYIKFRDAAKYVLDQIRQLAGADIADKISIDNLQAGYINIAKEIGGDKRDAMSYDSIEDLEKDNEPDQRSSTNLESDSGNAGTSDAMGAEGVRTGRDGNGGTGGPGVQGGQSEVRADRGGELRGSETASAGERGNLEIYTGATELSPSSAGNSVDSGSRDSGLAGSPVEPDAAKATSESATGPSELRAKAAAQAEADKAVSNKRGIDAIRAALPVLTENQQEDVAKAEDRFAVPDGYGMLFTNGTGTGKTFTGLGVIKRFANQGKKNILIVAPNDKIIEDWQKSGTMLGLDLSRLADTNDAGKGIVITTYANMGQNNALASRDWDLVVHDEAHYLAMDKDGTNTNALKNLRAITLHPDGVFQRAEMLHGDIRAAASIAQKEADLAANSDGQRDWPMAKAHQDRANKLNSEFKAKQDAIKEDVSGRQGARRTRALFLSATPFAYEKTVDWANGYIFDYNEGRGDESREFRGYNQGSNSDQFMMQHFGYRMRYGKLTQPDAKVDSGLMQRQFNSWLKKKGSLSGRMLDVSADYDRKFILVDSAIGQRIDEALEWFEVKRKAQNAGIGEAGERIGAIMAKADPYVDALNAVRDHIGEKFDYLSRRYLLESIKAREVVPHVREHLAMGRKVVVFHDYKKGGGFNPFILDERMVNGQEAKDATVQAAEWNRVVREFNAEFRDIINSDLFRQSSPIDMFKQEFPNVLLFNGDVPQKQRRANVATFQDDASGPQVILVQSAAGKEGISLHDTTGKHQRVLFNLGQPTQPTTAIQQEGRIYRTGQVTDAMFRYLNTGTNWEKWAFATTIAQRASAAENLGMGEQARALKDAFITGFEESGDYRAGMENEGKGGKERDKAANDALTEYDRARAFYFGTQKKTSKTKAQEGADYFATPEPVGLKMVEWADIRPGEKVLEPSAGHGAIARWIPDSAEKTAIEPSMALRPRLAMVFDGQIIDSDFESLNVVNKFDAIVMNPPFGTAGKTAVDHLAKAATHLRDGGRIVALLPTGPAADKKFDKWFYEESSKPAKPLGTISIDGKEVSIYKGDSVESRASWAPAGVVTGWRNGAPMVKATAPEFGGAVSMVSGASIKSITPGDRTESVRPAKDLYMIGDIKLPGVTFERAGTGVMTRIVVIEKVTDNDAASRLTERQRDYSDIGDINGLFDKIEDVSLPSRSKPIESEPEPAATQNRTRAEKPAPAKVGDVVTVNGNEYAIEIYTTNDGKDKRGIWMEEKEAKEINPRAFKSSKMRGTPAEGKFFVDEYWLNKRNPGASGNIATTATISPADKAIYGMSAEGKSAADILKFIASASRSPFNRQVAKLLLKTGINPTITAGDSKGWKFNAGEGNKYAAGYDPQKDMISLFRPAASERNMLHELIHAASLKALSKKGMAAGQMKALFAHVTKHGKSAGLFYDQATMRGVYGMANIDEFIAEAFSNPKFQSMLKQVSAMPVGGKPSSAWNWFIRVIRGILGLKQGQDNALSQALDIGIGVMRENMALKEAPKNYNVRGMADKDTVAGKQAPTSAGDGLTGSAKQTRLTPKWAAGDVYLRNANLKNKVSLGPNNVFIRDDGRVVIDGNVVSPGDDLYLNSDNQFVKSISDSEREKIAESLRYRIDQLVKDSEGINRSVAKSSPSQSAGSDSGFDIFSENFRDPDEWKYARYPNARRGYTMDLLGIEAVDAISDKHDPDAIKQYVVDQYLKDKVFKVGGYLHIDDGQRIDGRLANAIYAYRAMGGRIGKSVLDALGDKSYIKTYDLDPNEGVSIKDASDLSNVTELKPRNNPNEPSASAGSDDIRYNVAGEGWSVSEQAKEMVMRLAGRPMLDPADPFAAENARLREQDQSLWSKAKKQLRRYLAPGGLLPQSVFAEKIKRDSEFQAVEFDVRHLIGGLERAVKEDFGADFDKLTKDQMRPITEALAGNVPASLPESTKTAAIAMRQYIDGMSTEYLKIIQEKIDAKMLKAMETGKDADKAQAINDIELFEKIKGNIGRYVHRSYQAFDDPKWFEKVPSSVLNASRLYLKQGYMEAGETDAKAAQLAEVTLHEILKNGTAYDSMESFIAESKLGAKDLSVLMRRKEVPPQIRALLGEYPDARLNFTKSATKMGRLIWNTRFLDRIRDIGMGAFFFEGKDRPANATTQIAADGSEVYAPLNGLWTFPETAQAFKDALGKEQMSDLYRAIVRANGIVKYGKTILAPTTAMRNWQSAMFFSLANGHFDLTQMKKSISAFREQVSQKATGSDLAYLRHLKQLGVVYDTPYAGEMAKLMQDARMEELLSTDKGDALRWFRKANQLAQGFYAFGDDFWKIIGFENEKAGLMKAGLTLQEAEVEAAKRIRDTYPTYSMVGRGIQWLSRFPLAGTFVSFPAEIIRTSGNMLRTVASDLKSDNPKLRELGMRRAAGMALVSAAFWSLAAISKAMAGVGDDEEEAIRDLAPEWQKNSTFLYVGRDEKGNLRYFDMSFLDPYGYFKRPITAMMRNQPWEESLASGLRGMLEPFLGTDIAAGAIFEAVANQKDSGGKVYKEKDGAIDQAVDIADHLRKALQPGFVGNAERLVKAATDVRRSSGQPYSVEDELVALVGWRATTTDPKTALYYRSFEFTDAATEARKTITDTLRDANTVTPEDIADAKLRAKAKQEKAFKEMSRLVGAAEAAGMSKMQIVQTLRLSNISQSNIAALMQGRTPEVTVTPQVAAQAIRQAMTMRGKEFASEVADRYRTAMKN